MREGLMNRTGEVNFSQFCADLFYGRPPYKQRTTNSYNPLTL